VIYFTFARDLTRHLGRVRDAPDDREQELRPEAPQKREWPISKPPFLKPHAPVLSVAR